MAHMYTKDPPRFATDPWAWDYTRDRIEANTGIPYDQWESRHFAGAAAMYKNVIKKYAASIAAGNITPPKECMDCGQIEQHYVDDYVCKNCRAAIEAAPSYAAASATITTPDSLDAIREALYRSLGHDKADAKKGRTPMVGQPIGKPPFAPNASTERTTAHVDKDGTKHYGVMARQVAEKEAQVTQYQMTQFKPAPQTGDGKVSRNYRAMAEPKLRAVIAQLDEGLDTQSNTVNEAVMKVLAKGESVEDHLEAALRVAQERGIVV
jgi:hypothetical protein